MVAALHVQGLTGQSAAARETLAQIAADAAERGLTSLELEGGLALGEVEVAAGEPAGAERLEDLARDAEQRGCLLIARKARGAVAVAGG